MMQHEQGCGSSRLRSTTVRRWFCSAFPAGVGCPGPHGIWLSGPHGGSAATTAGGRSSERSEGATAGDQVDPFRTIRSNAASPLMLQTACGSEISSATTPAREPRYDTPLAPIRAAVPMVRLSLTASPESRSPSESAESSDARTNRWSGEVSRSSMGGFYGSLGSRFEMAVRR